MSIDNSLEFVPINIAVLTISDTRTEDTDTSGALLKERISTAGHHCIVKKIIPDDIKIIMRYPTLNDMDISFADLNSDDVFSVVKRCVHEIHEGEKVYNKVDISDSELDEFIDSLTGEKFAELMEFFDTMPKVQHSVEITNPNTKKKGEVLLEGLQSFFD